MVPTNARQSRHCRHRRMQGWLGHRDDRRTSSCSRRCDSNCSSLVGIDMPIGLDRRTTTRVRHRGAEVPRTRAAVRSFPHHRAPRWHAPTIRSALAAARAATGRGISKQTFNIMRQGRRARSADRRDESEHRVIEVHPECAFKMMNGGRDSAVEENRRRPGDTSRAARAITSSYPRPLRRARRPTTCSTPTPCCGACAIPTRRAHACSATASAMHAASRCASSAERSASHSVGERLAEPLRRSRRPPHRTRTSRGQKKPRSPSLRRRGTTCTWRWATLWLTTLLIATNVPSQSSAAGIRAETRCTRSKNGRRDRRRGRQESRRALAARPAHVP